jgi:hypothetical protein
MRIVLWEKIFGRGSWHEPIDPEEINGPASSGMLQAQAPQSAVHPERPQRGHPPAGWYTDSNNSAQQRWWDGRTWTQHTRAKVGGGGNPVAATGFALGVASFFLFSVPIFGLLLSLATIVVSSMGLPQAPGTAKKYRVFAVLGVILGVTYALMATLFLVTGR